MQLTGCNLQPQPAVNNLFDGCCCEISCNLILSPAESTRQISTIALTTTGGNTSSIVSIDGTPYTTPTGPPLPLSLGSGGSIAIVFNVCAPSGIGSTDTISLSITWTNAGGGTQVIDHDLTTLNQNLYFTPTIGTVNFGTIPVGSSAQQVYNFNNPTICDTEIFFSFFPVSGLGCTDVSLNQVSPFTVPAGTNLNFNLDYAPTTAGNIDCLLTFDICGTAQNARLAGESVVYDDCINCTNITYYTENNFLDPESGLCSDYPGGSCYNLAAIGEKKKITFEFFYVLGMPNGFEIWFNPEMFADFCDFAAKYPSGIIDSIPPVSFYIEYFAGIGSASMVLTGAGASSNSQRNYSATFIEGATVNEFSIEFEFYLTADVDNWLTATTLPNNARLLKNSFNATTNLTNTTPSVYNTAPFKKTCHLFYCLDPSILVTDPVTGASVPFTCHEVLSVKTAARFYNKGLYNGPSEMINPVLNLERTGSPVTTFSTLSETKIEFEVDSLFALSNCVFWLIDATGFDNSVDFLDNYDSSRGSILTDPGVTIIDNHLKSPSISPTNIGGLTYRTTAHVNNTLTVGQEMYLIAIPYANVEGGRLVNSFIFGPYEVTDQPTLGEICCELDFKNFFQGYNQTFENDCFTPTMKERIETQLNIKGDAFRDVCLPLLGWTRPGGEWIDLVESLDLLVYREEIDFPSAGETTTFVFGSYRSERTPGFPGNWNNLNPPFIVGDGGSGELPEPKIVTAFETRVRYEQDLIPASVLIADNTTKYTRTNAGPLAATYISTVGASYDWAGQDIFFEYQLTLDLSSLVSSGFKAVQVFRSKIVPFDFEGETPRGLDEVKFFYPDEANPAIPGDEITGPFCYTKTTFIFVRVHKSIPENMNLIATVDFTPFGVGNLEEEESYASTALVPLTQLSSDTMFDVDSTFDNVTGFAFFKVDLTELGPGTFEICGIGKVIKQ